MVTVSALRNELIEYGMSQDEADSIVGKQNLLNKLEEVKVDKASEELFDDAEVDVEEGTASDESDASLIQHTTEPPLVTDTAWAEYALSHLEENEKIKGHPKADSLRRLTELLIGPVVSVHTEVPQSPNIENGGRAVVIVTIEVYGKRDGPYPETVMNYSGSADVFPGNTETLFAKFAVATAETRAEGRAYRKALRLINVVTAEELVDESEIYDPADLIDSHQITGIEQMCGPAKHDININALLKLHNIDTKVSKLSKSKARELCRIINSYAATGVPENLRGYKTDWK